MIDITNYIFLNNIFQIFFFFGIFNISIFILKFINKNEKIVFDINYFWLISFIFVLISSIFSFYYLFFKVNHNFILLLIYTTVLYGFIFYIKNFSKIQKFIFNFKFKILEVFLLLFFISFFLLSLAPPTDIDSIDYHLGAPLNWYNNFGYYQRYDWLHYRIAGLGENLNLIGIYLKTYNIGQLFQFFGLVLAILFGSKYLNNKEHKTIFYFLILSCPLLIFLVSTQKFQLFPSSLIFCSIIYSIYEKKIKNTELIFIIFCLAFTVGCKFSFILPASIAWLIIFKKCYDNKKILNLFIISLVAFFVVIYPLILKNHMFYGDPFSPLFENFKRTPDETILNFLEYNKTFAANPNNLIFLFNLFIPRHIGALSEVLGLLPLVIFFINFRKIDKKSLNIIYLISLLFILIFFSYRGMGRYYLEIFFLISFFISKNFDLLKFKIFFKRLIIIQSILIFFVVLFGVTNLTYGIFSKKLYANVLKKNSYGYNVANWVKDNTKKIKNNEKILLNDVRFYSFFKNKYVSNQYYRFSNKEKSIPFSIEGNIKYILYTAGSSNFLENINNCINFTEKKEKTFTLNTRNPLNKKTIKYYLLTISRESC